MIRHINDRCLEEIFADFIVDGGNTLWAIAFIDYGSIPCDHFRPELAAVSLKLEGKILFYWIDACENPSVTDTLGVVAVPTLLVFRGEEEIGRYEGPYSRAALAERLGKLVGKA